MSYTTIYKVPERGPIEEYRTFSNSHRGAWTVWVRMQERYLPGHDMYGFGARRDDQMQKVWDLAKDTRVPLAHRLTMRSTFDRVMVRREDLLALADAFEQFAADFQEHGSIFEQEMALRELAKDTTCYAVCWNQTSVNGDAWEVDDPETEESRMYDVALDSKHWFMDVSA